jgi:hypothetical protein
MGLMSWQLGSFNSFPVRYEGKKRPFFVGKKESMALATDRSVKSLSGGVAVIARYVFDPGEKKLYYAEMPFDPYHSEPIEEFLREKPGEDDSWPAFYSVEVADLSFKYIKEKDGAYEDVEEGGRSLPSIVVVKWSSAQEDESSEELKTHTQRITLGFLSSPPSYKSWLKKKGKRNTRKKGS